MDIELNEIIDSYNQYVSKIPTGCMRVVELFQQDKSVIALEQVANFSEGISWLISAKNYLIANDINITWNEQALIEFLKEINSGLEIQDYVLVTDLFEYEIIPFFENVDAI